MIPRLKCASEQAMLGSTLGVSELLGLEWDQRICIPNKFSDDIDAACLEAILCELPQEQLSFNFARTGKVSTKLKKNAYKKFCQQKQYVQSQTSYPLQHWLFCFFLSLISILMFIISSILGLSCSLFYNFLRWKHRFQIFIAF